MSSLYYSGDTGTNRGTSLRRPWDARRRAQIRSTYYIKQQKTLSDEQAQVERRDPLSRDIISNLPMTSYTRDAFSAKYLNRRGNRSVPKKYLKTSPVGTHRQRRRVLLPLQWLLLPHRIQL
jgi:hypothetical protein